MDISNLLILYDLFDSAQKTNFVSNQNEISKFLESNNEFDLYFFISGNKVLRKIPLLKDEQDYINFSAFNKKIMESLKNPLLKELFSLVSDKKTFEDTLKKKLGDSLTYKTFKILLNSLRLCLLSVNKENPFSTTFGRFFKNDLINYLKHMNFPGIEKRFNRYLDTYNFLIDHFNRNPSYCGAYVCSCGFYYEIDPPGFPSWCSIYYCPICRLKIGYDTPPTRKKYFHGMVLRKGHYRIYKDKADHDRCTNTFGDDDENIPNMTLDEYKEKIIDPSTVKFNKISKGYFCPKNKEEFEKIKILSKNVNDGTYRLLHFGIFSHIFFANILGFITDDEIKDYCLIEGMTLCDIIKADWELFEKYVLSKGVENLDVFYNMILKEFSDIIQTYNNFSEELTKFEEKYAEFLEKSFKNYDNYRKTTYSKIIEIMKFD